MPSLADRARLVALGLEDHRRKIVMAFAPLDDTAWAVHQRPSAMALAEPDASEKLGLPTRSVAALVQLGAGQVQAPRHVKCAFLGASRHRARMVARGYVHHVHGDASA